MKNLALALTCRISYAGNPLLECSSPQVQSIDISETRRTYFIYGPLISLGLLLAGAVTSVRDNEEKSTLAFVSTLP